MEHLNNLNIPDFWFGMLIIIIWLISFLGFLFTIIYLSNKFLKELKEIKKDIKGEKS
jgi:hypothetical protein